MVLPYFDYGDVVYGNTCQDGLDKLQPISVSKSVCNRGHDTANLHSDTRSPLLKDRRLTHVNNFLYSRLGNPVYEDNRNIRDWSLITGRGGYKTGRS